MRIWLAVPVLNGTIGIMPKTKSKPSNQPPELRIFATMWALTHQPSREKEWPLEQKMKEVKKAGFDGLMTRLTSEHRALGQKLGLALMGAGDVGSTAKVAEFLASQKENGAHQINVQLADHDTTTATALNLAIRLMHEAEKLGVEPSVEIHRDTCTETPEKAYALAAAYRKATGKLLPMTFDLSHVALVKHLNPPFSKRLLVAPALIQRSRQFHMRPFNGHHCQIPVTNGKGKLTKEIQDWLPFAEDLFATWLAGKNNRGDRSLFVALDVGPVASGYGLSIFPNVWKDTVVLRGLVRNAWDNVMKRDLVAGPQA